LTLAFMNSVPSSRVLSSGEYMLAMTSWVKGRPNHSSEFWTPARMFFSSRASSAVCRGEPGCTDRSSGQRKTSGPTLGGRVSEKMMFCRSHPSPWTTSDSCSRILSAGSCDPGTVLT